jgi:hypothetical protein
MFYRIISDEDQVRTEDLELQGIYLRAEVIIIQELLVKWIEEKGP